MLIDTRGLFGRQRRTLTLRDAAGLSLIAAGILLLLHPFALGSAWAIPAAFGAGLFLVISRELNAAYAGRHGLHFGSLVNYLTGLGASLLAFVVLGGAAFSQLPTAALRAFDRNPLYLLGGAGGLLSIYVMNVIVRRLTAVRMTVLFFIGQFASALLFDSLRDGRLAWTRLLALVFIAGGLLAGQRRRERVEA